jgi:uncharacterized membrane protein YphA (DoxX/SURF4 family)
METLFPQILFLGPMFAPFILRIGVAIAFALTAHTFYQHRAELASMPYPIIGKPGIGLAWFAAVATAILALFLATGFETQATAIIGCAGAIKCWFFAKQQPTLFSAGRLTYFLIALVCLSLIITGAGAFAFDKPY